VGDAALGFTDDFLLTELEEVGDAFFLVTRPVLTFLLLALDAVLAFADLDPPAFLTVVVLGFGATFEAGPFLVVVGFGFAVVLIGFEPFLTVLGFLVVPFFLTARRALFLGAGAKDWARCCAAIASCTSL
jgi:hypothetical protein